MVFQEDDNEHPSLSETHEKLLAIEKQIASFDVQFNGKFGWEFYFNLFLISIFFVEQEAIAPLNQIIIWKTKRH